MERITPERPWPLHDTAASRQAEAAASAALAPHTLMQRAGLAVARLAMAVAPHARTVWIACGPGNNGGDGFEAAVHLKAWGKDVVVTWAGDEEHAPADAAASLQRARSAGVQFASEVPARFDVGIDAMLGLGVGRPLEGRLAEWSAALRTPAPVLAVDLPSGLSTDTGTGMPVRATHTLSLLTLKPGLFTGVGRDHAGDVWFDDLDAQHPVPASAWLTGAAARAGRPHDSHKGRFGDVAIVGGAPGMVGAALLAGTAALHAGAGRVFVAVLGEGGPVVDPAQPDLMFRHSDALDLANVTVACGCGGGEAVRQVLPKVIAGARELVLDADALNAVSANRGLQSLLAARGARGAPTVLTPHPLEAARLLGASTADVQADRLSCAQKIADRFGCVVVLKGSGSVTAAPGKPPFVNPTGSGRLATGGTGDVLAGLISARLHGCGDVQLAAAQAVHEHGSLADAWPAQRPLTASALARALLG